MPEVMGGREVVLRGELETEIPCAFPAGTLFALSGCFLHLPGGGKGCSVESEGECRVQGAGWKESRWRVVS